MRHPICQTGARDARARADDLSELQTEVPDLSQQTMEGGSSWELYSTEDEGFPSECESSDHGKRRRGNVATKYYDRGVQDVQLYHNLGRDSAMVVPTTVTATPELFKL